MKFTPEIIAALQTLKDAAENDFEKHRINVLERDLTAPPVVEVIDDNHQKFDGITYKTIKSGHYSQQTLLHRAVYTYFYGDISDWDIHHRDHNKANNDIANLQMVTKSEHRTIHNYEKSSQKYICENCGKEFFSTNTSNVKFCSKKCCAIAYKKSKENQVVKNCVVCGKSFETFKSENVKCCSKDCVNKLILKKKGKKPKTLIIKTCPVCGKNFSTKKSDAVYCSKSCYVESQKQKALDNNNEKICLHCGKSFVPKSNKNQKYCSQHCSASMPRENRRRSEQTCVVCGKKFLNKSHNKVLCCSRSCGVKLVWQKRKQNADSK